MERPESAGEDAEDSCEDDIDHKELKSRFWLLVALFNVGPIAFFVGVFLVAFEDAEHGYAVAAVGLLVTVAGLRIYRRTRNRIETREH